MFAYVPTTINGDTIVYNGNYESDSLLIYQEDNVIKYKVNGEIQPNPYMGFSKIVVNAGDGDDVVQIDPTVTTIIATTLNGGNGNDSLTGSAVADVINGEDGNDTLTGDVGNDSLDGSTGADSLLGQGGNDYMVGGDGDDWLDGGKHGDEMYGGLGNDTLVGGAGQDYMYGNEDADQFYALDGEIDHVFGGPGTDNVVNSDSGDILA